MQTARRSSGFVGGPGRSESVSPKLERGADMPTSETLGSPALIPRQTARRSGGVAGGRGSGGLKLPKLEHEADLETNFEDEPKAGYPYYHHNSDDYNDDDDDHGSVSTRSHPVVGLGHSQKPS